MAPLLLSVESGKCPGVSSGFADFYKGKPDISNLEQKKQFASIAMSENKSFDFLRVLRDGIIAGGTAGAVVETILYPIDTIKTRLQAAHGGSKVHWRGLYSGLTGNLIGVLPASAVFVGIYEHTKQKLLKLFPDSLSAFAHLTAGAIGGAASSLIRVPTELSKECKQGNLLQLLMLSGLLLLTKASEAYMLDMVPFFCEIFLSMQFNSVSMSSFELAIELQ